MHGSRFLLHKLQTRSTLLVLRREKRTNRSTCYSDLISSGTAVLEQKILVVSTSHGFILSNSKSFDSKNLLYSNNGTTVAEVYC